MSGSKEASINLTEGPIGKQILLFTVPLLLGMTFTSPSFYSLVYNGSYMLPNTLLALLFAALLYAPLKKYILAQDLA